MEPTKEEAVAEDSAQANDVYATCLYETSFSHDRKILSFPLQVFYFYLNSIQFVE